MSTSQGLWFERPPHLHGRPVLLHCPACILFLHCWSKLEKDVQLNFSIVTPTNTLAVTVHVQGSSPVSAKPGADTAAEWLTKFFIIPRIQQQD